MRVRDPSAAFKKRKERKIIMAYVILFVLIFGIAFLIDTGIVWIICWALKAIGITTIGGWTVAFSWPLVILFIVVETVLNAIFKSTNSK